MRRLVFRGGGLTKVALYLRGLVEILDHIGGGGELEPLLVGKVAVEYDIQQCRDGLHNLVLRVLQSATTDLNTVAKSGRLSCRPKWRIGSKKASISRPENTL